MPFMNGTGPEGQGSGTGRGRGRCAGGDRRRFRQGFGRGRCGGFAGAGDDREQLEAQAGWLERKLQRIRERIRELNSRPAEGDPKQED